MAYRALGVVVVSALLVGGSAWLDAQSGRSVVEGALMTAGELAAVPSRAPDHRIAYGSDPSQYAELRVPDGSGPHPLVALIHGGCFKAAYATARSFAALGDALKDDGIATWNIEYRRLGETGSGWPGTYRDVGQALDHVRAIAREYHLDLGRVVVVGGSYSCSAVKSVADDARQPPDGTFARVRVCQVHSSYSNRASSEVDAQAGPIGGHDGDVDCPNHVRLREDRPGKSDEQAPVRP